MSDSVSKYFENQVTYSVPTTPASPDYTKEAYTILSIYNSQAVRIANSILDKVEEGDEV